MNPGETFDKFLYRNLIETADVVAAECDNIVIYEAQQLTGTGRHLIPEQVVSLLTGYVQLIAERENVNTDVDCWESEQINGIITAVQVSGFDNIEKAKTEAARLTRMFEQRDVEVYRADVRQGRAGYDATVQIVSYLMGNT